MAVVILTLICSIFMGAAVWFVVGSRLTMSEDARQNEFVNLAVYVVGAIPIAFVLIFFGVG